jgi:hypothetical protein
VQRRRERDAYKWLCVAYDFGHEKAASAIEDVLEVSNLRYDDDGFEVAAAHWEHGVAYLEGKDALPCDLVRAREHLANAFRQHDLAAIRAGTLEKYDSKPLQKRLTEQAKQLLADALTEKLKQQTSSRGPSGSTLRIVARRP